MPAKIAIIYYTTYGHIRKLVDATAAGVKAAKGADGAPLNAEVTIYQFPEILSDEILAKQYAAPKDTSIPVIKATDLPQYDGFIFAFPTRYGRAVAQASAFFDSTGGLWASQALNGKMGSIVTSTATQHGGQETTVATTLPFFAHHGIIFVPIGYKSKLISTTDAVQGGSPWGATTVAGPDGSRQPSELELELATYHGEHFASIVTKYVS